MATTKTALTTTKTLAQRLRYARKLATAPGQERDELSCRELGRLAGKDESYVSLIETGKRQNLGAEVADRLAEVLGTSVDWLVFGRGEAPSRRAVVQALERARSQAAA